MDTKHAVALPVAFGSTSMLTRGMLLISCWSHSFLTFRVPIHHQTPWTVGTKLFKQQTPGCHDDPVDPPGSIILHRWHLPQYTRRTRGGGAAERLLLLNQHASASIENVRCRLVGGETCCVS